MKIYKINVKRLELLKNMMNMYNNDEPYTQSEVMQEILSRARLRSYRTIDLDNLITKALKEIPEEERVEESKSFNLFDEQIDLDLKGCKHRLNIFENGINRHVSYSTLLNVAISTSFYEFKSELDKENKRRKRENL